MGFAVQKWNCFTIAMVHLAAPSSHTRASGRESINQSHRLEYLSYSYVFCPGGFILAHFVSRFEAGVVNRVPEAAVHFLLNM